ncbi:MULTISPECIES: FtsW/RodA/SpoVE family cell cycle protein [Streptomycetaceae]|uniref:FtsW/RodA/SpoVE family cell cycle protein n=1 Tax=Streptantibioticus cattleyicolor (strain ATCC 35852 / DSM 46488 / JCM 4925 / NBRC 14057 / NRRL 8057) TaxID=1003195 RepID=F8JSD4_STREN|nr:FtsW/RodA/SpoVE family cell cycle protein [Streptantibioticus cattleyicolor]AEW95449.1 FtsW/RodA/SpoVE family cell cycle protein [Streptantibioticus cattleyicolor NRRL 8057 = DSM 46488]MYS60017.1 FtsW/RodA/SpoVE family cell cycle protein [Streptomyces sp. SID5468]CCB75791.1 putative cell division protein ftsW [Streptantibioticus cattleyicolor NRRL 8057 = DSM 46488]
MSSVSNTTTISSIGAPNRRNTELLLLLFAVAVPVLAYANVGLAKNGSVPSGMLGYGLGLGLLAGVGHLIVRKFAPYADPLMLPIATLLNGLGLVLIYRLDLEHSVTTKALGGPRAPGQLMWSALGIALFVAVLFFLKDHRILQRYTYISGLVALLLLVAPMFFPAVNGSKLWIVIPGLGSIQPGEFAKIILAVFFSGYLMVKRDALALASRRFMGLYLPRGRDLGPILVIWALSMGILVVETDLGSTLLYFGLFVLMLYVATERTSWVVFGLLLAVGGATAVGATSSHVMVRVHQWLDPFAGIDKTGATEAAQVAWSFGSGGVLGSGLGQGLSRLIGGIGVKSDYILATVGEELGLAGLMAILLLYGLLVERGIRTALAARDPFGKLLAIGLASAMALQVFVVAGGVTGLIPLTGMTMPFLAQGGSSVVANWALVAILLRISDTARRPAPAPASSPDAEPTQVVRL